jgi:hypothetical protein
LRNEGTDVSTSRLPKNCKRKEETWPNCIPGNIDVSTRTQQVLHLEIIRREFLNMGLLVNPFSIAQPLGFRFPQLSSHEFNPKIVGKEKEWSRCTCHRAVTPHEVF